MCTIRIMSALVFIMSLAGLSHAQSLKVDIIGPSDVPRGVSASVTCIFKNTSKNLALIAMDSVGLPRQASVALKSIDGQLVERVNLPLPMGPSVSVSDSRNIKLLPNESIARRVDLAGIYKIAVAGEYNFSVQMADSTVSHKILVYDTTVLCEKTISAHSFAGTVSRDPLQLKKSTVIAQVLECGRDVDHKYLKVSAQVPSISALDATVESEPIALKIPVDANDVDVFLDYIGNAWMLVKGSDSIGLYRWKLGDNKISTVKSWGKEVVSIESTRAWDFIDTAYFVVIHQSGVPAISTDSE